MTKKIKSKYQVKVLRLGVLQLGLRIAEYNPHATTGRKWNPLKYDTDIFCHVSNDDKVSLPFRDIDKLKKDMMEKAFQLVVSESVYSVMNDFIDYTVIVNWGGVK